MGFPGRVDLLPLRRRGRQYPPAVTAVHENKTATLYPGKDRFGRYTNMTVGVGDRAEAMK